MILKEEGERIEMKEKEMDIEVKEEKEEMVEKEGEKKVKENIIYDIVRKMKDGEEVMM